MNVYYTKEIKGIYPVGSAVIAVARDKGHARRLMLEAAAEANMPGAAEELPASDIILVDADTPQGIVVRNGDY